MNSIEYKRDTLCSVGIALNQFAAITCLMAPAQKTGQLRVRIAEDARIKLAMLAKERAGATVSDLVREAIAGYLERGGIASPCESLSSEGVKRLLELASKLERKTNQILEDCVEGIHTAYNEDKEPLILLELKLRRKYHDSLRMRCGAPESEATTQLRKLRA